MSPSSRLVAFFFGEGGEVVADSTLLEIDDGLPNKAGHNYVKFRLRLLCCLGRKRRDRQTCWASIWLLSLLYMSLRGGGQCHLFLVALGIAKKRICFNGIVKIMVWVCKQ